MAQDDPEEKFRNWLRKIYIIKKEIESLEKINKGAAYSVAVFLLKCQVIEFELKQLISSLDSFLHFNSRSRLIRYKIRWPKDLNGLTLGQLCKEMQKFEGSTSKLTDLLIRLVKSRNDFTHHLFNIGKSIDEIEDEATKGSRIADQVLDKITKIGQKIEWVKYANKVEK